MVAKKDAIAMAEFLYYIKKFDKVYIDKIPKKLMELFKENYDKEYVCNFDYNKPLKELSLTPETQALINMVCYKYWCESDEQRRALKEKWQENSDKKEKELREKYNPDNIFKKKVQTPKEEVQLVEYKESIFKKFKKFIFKVLHIKS